MSLQEERGKRYIIINVGKGKVCDAIGIQSVDDREALGIGGTTGREDIVEIVDHWGLERIMEGCNEILRRF